LSQAAVTIAYREESFLHSTEFSSDRPVPASLPIGAAVKQGEAVEG